MRLAVVDLGTNAVRLDVHELQPEGVTRLHRERLMVRLGQDVFSAGKLHPDAVQRTILAFKSFRDTCRELRVEKTTALGTSALREASDSDVFLARLKSETGFDVRVISGAEEARLIAQGVLAFEKNVKGRVALLDVGGGSAEITLCRKGRVVRSVSVDLGVARLQQTYLKTIPPSPDAVDRLRGHARGVLRAAGPRGGWPSVGKIIGSGGILRALWELHRRRSAGPMDEDALKGLARDMARKNKAALLRMPGMEAKRVDTIFAGAVLSAEAARALDAGDVQPTEVSLRDGVLEEEIRRFRRLGRPAPSPQAGAAEDLARRFSADGTHRRQVAALAERLFDDLRPFHRLAPAWRGLLSTAATLHDVGEAVNPVHHERHGAYIIRNADLPGLAPWETEFVARLCLLHKGGKVDGDDVSFWGEPAKRAAFMKLLALLRVADALDRHHAGLARIKSVRREHGRIVLRLAGPADLELEILRLEQKKELFEKVFGIPLTARR